MLYPEISEIIDFSKGDQYSARPNSSSLRKAMAHFLQAEQVTFNSLGDVFIYGKEDYANSQLDSFSELARFFLWFNRSWLKLATVEGRTYFASPVLKRGVFRSKWDTFLVTFQKDLIDQVHYEDNKLFVWVAPPLRINKYNESNYRIWFDAEVEFYGPVSHHRLKDKPSCYYIELPNDLDENFKKLGE